MAIKPKESLTQYTQTEKLGMPISFDMYSKSTNQDLTGMSSRVPRPMN